MIMIKIIMMMMMVMTMIMIKTIKIIPISLLTGTQYKIH